MNISEQSEILNRQSLESGISQDVLKQLYGLAEEYEITEIILFGSRARGDYRRTSDIDLAVKGGRTAEFALAADEETDTLLRYDIVDLGASVQQELLESILKEGKKLYEKI